MRVSKINTPTSKFIDKIGGSKGIRKELEKYDIVVDPSLPTKWRTRGIPAQYVKILSKLANDRNVKIGDNVLQEQDEDIAELLDSLGGCHVVAHELGSSIDTVRDWARKGVPTYKINQLKQLCKQRDVEFPRKIELKAR